MKNIARFARNVVDCVATVRMLKALDKPVAVYFEDIAINTLTQTGELLMVVMAAIAQGESEAKSESVKWGFQKRFEKGLPKLADLYGYTRDKRLLEIYEPEANVVRLIYQMFYDDKTIPEICYILNQQGIPSPRGGQWTYSTVKTILTNEKYSGDVLNAEDRYPWHIFSQSPLFGTTDVLTSFLSKAITKRLFRENFGLRCNRF